MPYYAVFDDNNGKPCMKGGFETQARAQKEIDDYAERTGGTVYYSKYWDMTRATRSIKHQRIKDNGFDEGSRNLSHKVGADYV